MLGQESHVGPVKVGLLLPLAGATMQIGVVPTTLEDNHMGVRGSLPGKPPSQQLQDRVPGQWSGAEEGPLGCVAAKGTVGYLLGRACSAQSQATMIQLKAFLQGTRTPAIFSSTAADCCYRGLGSGALVGHNSQEG